MADKVTDLTPISSAANDDVLHVVDVSDTSQNPAGSSRKISRANFLKGVAQVIAGYENYIVIKGTGNTNQAALEVNDVVMGVGAYFTGDFIIATVNTANPSQDSHFTIIVNLGQGV